MSIEVDGVQFQEPQGSYLLPLETAQLAPGATALYGWYQDWGPNQQRLAANSYKFQLAMNKKDPRYNPLPNLPMGYTEVWARNRLETALEKIGRGLVMAAFPTYPPYNKNAALLLQAGFRLLGRRCYPNANYGIAQYTTMPKGSVYSPDGYSHWIHIWVKDLGGLENCGESQYGRALPVGIVPETWKAPEYTTFPNCCGLKLRWSSADPKPDPYAPQANHNRYLSLCQIPANQKFSNGFKRFALYKDFKWGVNFDSSHVQGVQKCPHEFNLARIEKWELEQPLPNLGPIPS